MQYSFAVANHELELQSGMVFACPIPNESAADAKLIQNAIDTAIDEARYKTSQRTCTRRH